MQHGDSGTVAPTARPPAAALDRAWRGKDFANIVELLSHVDADHLQNNAAA
jgi:hypothetical protein